MIQERPIIFSGSSVRAILEGRKTQTRQLVRGEALALLAPGMFVPSYVASEWNRLSRLGYDGDRLWVRETFWVGEAEREDGIYLDFDATMTNDERRLAVASGRRRSSPIYLPRLGARILLQIRSVRIERLRSISPEDVLAEGVVEFPDASPHRRYGIDPLEGGTIGTEIAAYAVAWESIHGRGSWRLDPWVWVVDFVRISP